MRNAVVYLRRSTMMQEQSIRDQRTVLERYAEGHGYAILKEFIDDGVSGGAEAYQRQGFSNMVEFVENSNGRIDTLLVYDISRFSRAGCDEAGYFRYRLHKAGCSIVYVAERLPEGDAGDLVRDVLQWQKQEYRKQLARDILRGLISAAKQGRRVTGATPYGFVRYYEMPDGMEYLVTRGEQVVRPKASRTMLKPGASEEVAVVQRIFHMYVNESLAPLHIANSLNGEGIPPPHSSKPRKINVWYQDTIRRILQNPVYAGIACFNRCSKNNLCCFRNGRIEEVKGKKYRRNPEADWIKVENAHKAIVDSELFNRAQEIMRGRRRNRRNTARNGTYGSGIMKGRRIHLMSGLVYCGHCSQRMWATTPTVYYKGKKCSRRKYICSTYLRRGKPSCNYFSINSYRLDEFLLEVAKRQLFSWSKRIRNTVGTADCDSRTAAALSVTTKDLFSLVCTLDKVLSLYAKNRVDQCVGLSKDQVGDFRIENVVSSSPSKVSLLDIPGKDPQVLGWLHRDLHRLANAPDREPLTLSGHILRVLVRKVVLFFRVISNSPKATFSRFERGVIELNTFVDLDEEAMSLLQVVDSAKRETIIRFGADDLEGVETETEGKSAFYSLHSQ